MDWEKAKIISSIAATVVIPLVLLWLGNQFSAAIKERELQAKFVELAVQILRETPSNDTLNLRTWATQVINQYSGVPLSAEAKQDLIEKTPIFQREPGALYEGRMDLGNTEPGDGARFIGRGYLQIVGRANYSRLGKAIGVDLVSHPELAEEPEVAAKILVEWFLQRKDRLLPKLEGGDYVSARRYLVGGVSGAQQIATRTAIYKKLCEDKFNPDTINTLSGIKNPKWTKVHLPAIIKALNERGVSNPDLCAYILATAEHETLQGRIMKEGGWTNNP